MTKEIIAKSVKDSKEAKFWKKVERKSDSQCWKWTGTLDSQGYGQFFDEKWRKAHRYAWFYTYGQMPRLLILHSCDNPGCVNPAHLREGTHKDNSEDKVRRNRQPKGENHAKAKLSEKQVIEIKELIKKGCVLAQIARKFGVKPESISSIKAGRNWKYLNI